MQLTSDRARTIRGRLAAAAGVLLAAGLPAVAHAEEAPGWRFDGTALLYGEQSRATVVEPTARITRVMANGQSFSAEFGLDAMTGASPTGAMPTGRVQTTTSASGRVSTSQANTLPTESFQDLRGSLDLEWVRPLGTLVTVTTGGHYSREKDYQSSGVSGKVAVDLMHRLTTITVGGAVNRDEVFPTGGTRAGLSDPNVFVYHGSNDKRVNSVMVGVSRVLTRRWLVGVNTTRTWENGYLTEPYKVVSRIDPATGYTDGALSEKRPGTRARTSVLGSSVYHLSQDVLYTSYRWYGDDWGVHSHTVDFKLRHELGHDQFLQPHARFYSQTAADFFRFGLVTGRPLPAFASSDQRLGPLRSATVGGTYGFHLGDAPGEFTVRAEYLVQWGLGHPSEAVGVQRRFDLMPPESIGSVLVGYSVPF